MSQAGDVLFQIPIASGGVVKCSTPAAKVYLLEFTSPPDNRLKTDFCEALHLALDIIEFRHPPGVVITTSGISKFYSNGLDLEHATETPGFFGDTLFALWRRFLIYPMPTIALINGHAFAGALMLAMMHDYRIMNPQKGFVCLNEVDLGVPLKPPMSSIFRQKTVPATYRMLVLEGKRFTSRDAHNAGIVDSLGGLEDALKLVSDLNLPAKAAKGVYGELKREMFRETVHYLENHKESEARAEKWSAVKDDEDLGRDNRVKAWEKKAKL
ncbi:hypothetical protein ANO11243_001670 [Dothideomycetidae sp. 11243]|nr:hypothetical protein ANO11243_001670 [fungal sp. No.11243]